ncbi:MAG: PAS domain-containing protein, partial [Rickettsiales bacterium]
MIAGPYIVALDWRYGAISVLSGIAVLHGVGYAVQATVPIAVETGPWMLTLAAAYGYGLLTQVERFSRSAFRRRMEAEDQRVIVFTTVEDAVDGIIVLGWDDRVRLINKSASELIGVEVEDAVTRPIDELLRPLNFGASWFQGEPTTEFIGRLADTGEPVEFTGSNLRGSRRTVEMIARRSELKRSGDRFERRKTDR